METRPMNKIKELELRAVLADHAQVQRVLLDALLRSTEEFDPAWNNWAGSRNFITRMMIRTEESAAYEIDRLYVDYHNVAVEYPDCGQWLCGEYCQCRVWCEVHETSKPCQHCVSCKHCGTRGDHYCPAEVCRGECEICEQENCVCLDADAEFCPLHDIEVDEGQTCWKCRYELNNDDAEVDSMSSLAIEGR
jgi:hypothetical protein